MKKIDTSFKYKVEQVERVSNNGFHGVGGKLDLVDVKLQHAVETMESVKVAVMDEFRKMKGKWIRSAIRFPNRWRIWARRSRPTARS